MVFGSLIVDPIKLGDSWVGSNQMSISQESPNLFEGHSKRFFALVCLDFPRVNSVPLFKFRIVSQKNILYLFKGLIRVMFQFHQVRDVNKLFKRVVFNFFLRSWWCKPALSSVTKSTSTSLCRTLIRLCGFYIVFACISWFSSSFRCCFLSCAFLIIFFVSIFLLELRLLLQCNLLRLLLWHLSFKHSIVFKRAYILCPIFKCKHSMSMLEIFSPLSFILATIWIIKCTFAMSLS